MKVSFQTKRQLATEELRHAIRIGRYEPGQALRQNDVAADLGLSSTPVREAFSELTAAGLVNYEQHRGARVATMDVERIKQIYTARKIIETQTSKLAFEHITEAEVDELHLLAERMAVYAKAGRFEELVKVDEEFHLLIFAASRNEYLVAAVRNLWNSFPRYFMWNIGERIDEAVAEHRRMIELLYARDEAGFLATVSEHLDHSLETILSRIGEDGILDF
ncbi:GntR family transcriptional regulator [Aliamphritea spongicola]|uniref:GntR family transcriptional regulator n=1 Tax=Aliamphritea spongicola TaxID=707589 RepID=UPI00196A8FC1|nr:GntR family transcriptional regulator [Aliamphritea spongicola]MBN3562670.1 GntR family transcriptional regulator [Aliamphritea spongicola]